MKIIQPIADTIILGYVGEASSSQVWFNVSDWATTYGSGTFTVINQRATDASGYPVNPTYENGYVKWTLSSGDMAVGGYGHTQLNYNVGGAIAKSVIFKTFIYDSLGQQSQAPDPWQSWVNQVIAARDAILNMSATASVNNATGTPSVTVTKTTISGHENLDFAFKNIKGAKGDKGDTGDIAKSADSTVPFTLGCDSTGFYITIT